MEQYEKMIDKIFSEFKDIRYAAFYIKGQLVHRQKQTIDLPSAMESDRYEELLVNPTLITIAKQRGNIDCGGLRYIMISYGNFNQVIKELKGGHISLCFELQCDPIPLLPIIFSFLEYS